MAGTKDEASPLHVVAFPWLAFGHMFPYLELSKRLARRGHAVTFVSTPRNAARLGAVPPELSARLRVVALDLPEVEGLPDGAESTADVPPEKVALLKKAFDGLTAPFAELVAEACAAAAGGEGAAFSRKPDWIVLDFAQNWVLPIAEEYEIQCAIFVVVSGAFLAFTGPQNENEAHPRTTTEDYMVPPPWIPSPSTMAYRRHEAEWIAAGFRPNAAGVSDMDRFWEMERRPCCRLIFLRSCPEAEPPLFPLLTDLFAKPVVPAGLLLPDAAAADEADGACLTSDDEPTSAAMRWLDAQPQRSVIYVALGSEAPASAGHVRELALGLELSGARFLWALRLPAGGHRSGDPLLPDGFERRVAGRGVVCTGWVPQARVLAHAAVGAFLTHCGWGSTAEGLFRCGLPLVMLPFVLDQGLNARAAAARGLGVEVERDGDGGWFRGEDVAAAVRRVMVEEEGEALARNAREVQKVVGDRGRQEGYVDELVEHLQRCK
ncbi:hypothetical protein SETIT_2G076300v2 [Setaria italica]|uniref:Glycosyltransferase n=1 Tax=Setaria italica TaxID=4555 RepID=K3ZSQ8_SETIT|nr:UDP-glycosyltransferase 91C1 [Setaria italica]RCV09998.1 hypothetical protein SETIT_2G076300v2 [Setaria italica]